MQRLERAEWLAGGDQLRRGEMAGAESHFPERRPATVAAGRRKNRRSGTGERARWTGHHVSRLQRRVYPHLPPTPLPGMWWEKKFLLKILYFFDLRESSVRWWFLDNCYLSWKTNGIYDFLFMRNLAENSIMSHFLGIPHVPLASWCHLKYWMLL